MPLIEAELDKAAGAKIFCEFDMTHRYWQLILHEDDQECKSLVTIDGIYTAIRILHENLKANSHLHEGFMAKMPQYLKEKLLWVEDLSVAAKDVDDLLEYICLLYTSPSPRDQRGSRMPSSA